jgi:hypothetical protein
MEEQGDTPYPQAFPLGKPGPAIPVCLQSPKTASSGFKGTCLISGRTYGFFRRLESRDVLSFTLLPPLPATK